MILKKIKSVASRWSLVAGLGGWLLLTGWVWAPLFAQGHQIIEIQPISPTGRMLAPRLNGWQLEGSAMQMSPVAFEENQPERAPLIREYGLRDAAFGTYAQADGMKVRVEVIRMNNFVAAYGAYSLERAAQAQRVAVGAEGALDADRLGFFKGEYYVRLIAEPGATDSAALLDLARRLDEQVGARHSEIPVLIQHLPSDRLVPGTERFIAGPLALTHFLGPQDPNDVFLLSSEAVEAALAEYQIDGATSPVMIVEYHTPQLASTAYQQVQNYFQALPDAERARRILKREGNYIIQALHVQNTEAMQQIVDQIKYAPKIHWLKKNPFEDLQQFQSDEQTSLIDFYLTAFGFIGLSLLIFLLGGSLLGAAIFLWRRHRARLWPGFSDAGGMLRLNLDNLVLPQIEKKSPKGLPGR
ncbi:MAG: hypothetical protein HY314_17010 [Acidobacteria bacterium]|nr:hypothetical protein [Acidobacteriota bacterium]